jgi:hypothetical protein
VQAPVKNQATSPLKITTASKYKKMDHKTTIDQHTRRIHDLQKRNREYQKQIMDNNAEIDKLVYQITQHTSKLVGEDEENYSK